MKYRGGIVFFSFHYLIIFLVLSISSLAFSQELSEDESSAVLTEMGPLATVSDSILTTTPASVIEPVMTREAPPDSVMPPAINRPLVSITAQVVHKQGSMNQNPAPMVNNQNIYQMQFMNGESTQRLGRILTWGGLGAIFLGVGLGNPSLAGVGSLAFLAGVPVNGVGSTRMVRAANKLNPTAHVRQRGWAPYFTGIGLMSAGVVLLADAVSNENAYEENGNEINEEQAGTATLMFLAGGVCMFVSWAKFSASADDAGTAFSAVQFSGGPLFIPEVQGDGYAKGIQMVAAF